MSPTEYAQGVLLFGLMLAGTSAGAWLLLRRRFSQLAGAPKAVAYALLLTLGVMAVHLAPLALGVLDRFTVIVATALWLGGACVTRAVASAPAPAPPAERRPGLVAWGCAGIAGTAIVFMTLVILRARLTVAPAGVDMLNFHMPGVAAWLQTGSLWQIDVFLADVSPGHYPNNADVLVLATLLPWKSDFLSHLLMYPFWFMTGVSVYALATEVLVPRATAIMAGLLAMTIPAVSLTALEGGFVDTVMVFAFVTGLLFLVRHHSNGHTSELVLAGLALGLAFGTKWYAVSAVPTVVAIWVAARAWSRRSPAELLRQTAAVTGLVAFAGGIWMLRNLVESANPAFPVKVSLFGSTIFDAPVDRVRALAGFTIADYVDQPRVWADYILPQYRDAIAAPAAVVLAGALLSIAALVLMRRGGRREPIAGYVLAGLVVTALLGLAYSVTPYTAGGGKDMPLLVGADSRYVVPALAVAAVLAAWGASRFRWGPAVFGAVGLLAVADGLLQLKQGMQIEFNQANIGAALLMVFVAVGLAMAVGPPLAELDGRRRLRAAGVLVAILLVVLAAGGRTLQQDYLAKRYFGKDAVADALNTTARTGNRVGLTGIWMDDGLAPPLLAFGPRFGNHVAYVGRNDMDVLRRFRTRTGFTRSMARGRYNWLVVGRGRPPKPKVDEERWAESAGFRLEARSPRLALYRKTGG